MGVQVPPLLTSVKVEAKITYQVKKGRYRYAYLHIPASIKALVEGRYFKVEKKGNVVIYRISEPGPNTYKPVRYGKKSIYIRLPLENVMAKKAIIELLPDGFAVHLV
ncbi:hypothetical protein PABY_01990 [Pyrodictium abyssi]|uniref:Uncharacterized protein n=1 Tax=Pyrodictium abyssi TaxID=54256 RepID=A0ABM8IST9_9CREN|nr:hypothetical protein PABY_01990 [Pyrodictium abyssi]